MLICPYCKVVLQEVSLQVNLVKQFCIISGTCPKCGTVEFDQTSPIRLMEPRDLDYNQLKADYNDAIIRTKHQGFKEPVSEKEIVEANKKMILFLTQKASFQRKVKDLARSKLWAEMKDLHIVRQNFVAKYGQEPWFSGWELIQQIDDLLKD